MIYIIGDVHGCFNTLLALIDKLPTNAQIVFVGDLIDRGANSKDVVEFVRKNKYACVMGTHEAKLLSSNGKISISNKITPWGKDGGIECLESYSKNMSQFYDDMKWFGELPHYLIYENEKDSYGRKLLLSHACALNFIDEFQLLDNEECMQKLHYEYLITHNRLLYKQISKKYFNVFGHTPVDRYFGAKNPEGFFPNIENGIIIDKECGYANIDTGAVYKNNTSREILTALEFPTFKVFTQFNID